MFDPTRELSLVFSFHLIFILHGSTRKSGLVVINIQPYFKKVNSHSFIDSILHVTTRNDVKPTVSSILGQPALNFSTDEMG